jgi:hypothetical protein
MFWHVSLCLSLQLDVSSSLPPCIGPSRTSKMVKTSSKYCTMVQYLTPLRFLLSQDSIIIASMDIQSIQCLVSKVVDTARSGLRKTPVHMCGTCSCFKRKIGPAHLSKPPKVGNSTYNTLCVCGKPSMAIHQTDHCENMLPVDERGLDA